jgi:hypothetical protein
MAPAAELAAPRLGARRPEVLAAAGAHYAALAQQLDQDRLALCARLVSSLVAGDSDPVRGWRSGGFDGPTKAWLAFTEQFLYSAQSVTDEQVAALAAELTPAQVVALTAAVSLLERTQRLERFLRELGL